MMPDRKIWISVFVLLLLFIVTSYFAQKYQDVIGGYIEKSGAIFGSVVYVGATITSTVIAPITTLPFISVIANTWGTLPAALLTIIGSGIGGLLAFLIAKKYGQPVVEKLTSKDDLKKMERLIPREPEHAFWTIAFLHLVIPADVLSYALGIFTKVDARTYFFATLTGMTPSILLFAYTGTLSVKYQIAILGGGLIFIFYLFRTWVKRLNN